MKFDHLLVRYGELTLKGTNRKKFVNALKDNVNKSLQTFEGTHVKGKRDRMYISLTEEADAQEVIDRLTKIFGIKSVSPVHKTSQELEDIKNLCVDLAQDFKAGDTFKIDVKRVDKSFPLDTYALQRELGGAILQATEDITVDVKHPDHNVRVEVRMDGVYVFTQVFEGAGGLPVGTGGKTLLMLSGGIDSPVAGMEIMKRGVNIEAIHFHSPPFTSEKAKDKVIELTRILSERVGPIKLHIVPFTELQKQINKVVHPRYTMTSTRRMMLRVADIVLENVGAHAIVNGENLGQVASQTLKSMYAINDVTSTPILRPLVSLDKEDIIKKAREIGTFDVSIQPYEDCCTIFTPKNPVTEPDFDKVVKYESVFDFDDMVQRAADNIETLTINKDYKSEKDQNTDALMDELF
ncbi:MULTISPECIES: tRNA uracil 4-sulfurtransferase ThiI [unclassified Staphylococcus]|uniref:tRNA uracil 4-sulfurtransferase ThiI n=1 Tax=unclassified Staphylococcus TaxID=91994 RepID=UPI001880F540|nr:MULTISPECIES: tRNA uracil 4-sulfurtransferase ThiI [unclassified Staphylococcus]MBF2757682.1 tRNA 4-thiouridine(8) synthase ThiI [Staphylococcus haemolyticus]MBF2773299.1 tRNA 4-thiouridine(8) synthase ThiI [Staphylococcus haemolyticus]MBF2776878.1 tRNA 4-thiouridine(8) synthase ThiI [Staphylococcus haemolyticus]MBF2815132.1 tRNA 4-thiouridine(8) synthase ThiI [Staphylococcus haemolyticus]MBF9720690.1 tRNA 4-thiouridine(8) synthase ThiI [Staphylococcus haemolyticus]